MTKTKVKAHPRKGTSGVKRHSRNTNSKKKVPNRLPNSLIESGTMATPNAIIIKDSETHESYAFKPTATVNDVMKVTKSPAIWLDNTGIRPKTAHYGSALYLSNINHDKRRKQLKTLLKSHVEKSYPFYLGTWNFTEDVVY